MEGSSEDPRNDSDAPPNDASPLPQSLQPPSPMDVLKKFLGKFATKAEALLHVRQPFTKVECNAMPGAEIQDMDMWEQRASVALPKDLKGFYAIANGMNVSLSTDYAGAEVAVGHLRINSLFDLRPTTGVSSDFTCFVLDETPGVHTGEVLLCINNGTGKAEVWFRDLAMEDSFLADSFTSYFRLMLSFAGVTGWQLLFTSMPPPGETIAWLRHIRGDCLDLVIPSLRHLGHAASSHRGGKKPHSLDVKFSEAARSESKRPMPPSNFREQLRQLKSTVESPALKAMLTSAGKSALQRSPAVRPLPPPASGGPPSISIAAASTETSAAPLEPTDTATAGENPVPSSASASASINPSEVPHAAAAAVSSAAMASAPSVAMSAPSLNIAPATSPNPPSTRPIHALNSSDSPPWSKGPRQELSNAFQSPPKHPGSAQASLAANSRSLERAKRSHSFLMHDLIPAQGLHSFPSLGGELSLSSITLHSEGSVASPSTGPLSATSSRSTMSGSSAEVTPSSAPASALPSVLDRMEPLDLSQTHRSAESAPHADTGPGPGPRGPHSSHSSTDSDRKPSPMSISHSLSYGAKEFFPLQSSPLANPSLLASIDTLFPSDMPKQLFASGLDPHKTPTSAAARGGSKAPQKGRSSSTRHRINSDPATQLRRYPIASSRSAAKNTDSSRSLKFPVVSPQNAKAYKSGEVPDALGVRRVNSFFSLRGLAVSKQSTSMLQRKALSFRQQR